MADDLGLTQIGQIGVNVHDVKRAVGFYRDTLGMRLLFEIPNAAFFDCGGVCLMLSLPEQPEFDRSASIISTRFRTSGPPSRPSPPAAYDLRANRTLSPACQTTICGWRSSEIQRASCWH